MKKIVELIIKMDDLELEGVGQDAIAFVENPAIELDFLAFASEKFVKPEGGESEDEFIGRCIPALITEGYEQDQAVAICYSTWQNHSAFAGLKVSFDYHETLNTPRGTELAKKAIADGEDVYVISAGQNKEEFMPLITELGIDPSKVFATGSNKAKIEKIKELGIEKHYDNNQDVIDELGAVGQKFGINPGNLTSYVDQTGPLKKKEEMSEEQQQIVDYFASCGEEYNPEEAIFVKIKDNTFSDFTDLLDGVAALDILGRTLAPDQQGETVYRYAGPRAERGFCRAMLRLNRVYRPNEITGLNTANPGFGPGGTDEYSVLKYAGGPNCRHYWEELTMFKQDGRHVFINKGPVTATTQGGRGMSAADLTAAGQSKNMNAPSATGSVANNAYLAPRNLFSFSTNEEQRIATGAAMIPNKMILRKDENGNPYYVYFTEKTIRDIAEKVFEENKHNMTNIEHRSSETNTLNTLLESWIVEDPEMDKSKALGFSVPKGTWMVSYRVNDDKTWEMIKEGKLKGFSVEGYFIEKAEAARAQKAMEQMYADILNILKEVK